MKRRLGSAALTATPLDHEVAHGRNMIRRGDIVKFQKRPGCAWQRVTFMGAGNDAGGTFYNIIAPNGNQRFVRPDKIRRIQRGGGGRDRQKAVK